MDIYLDDSTNEDAPKHQEVRVLSCVDTIQTLTRLHERLKLKDDSKKTSKRSKKRIQALETLTLTLALVQPAELASESVVTMCQAVARCFPKLKTLAINSEMDDDTRAAFPIPIQVFTVLLHPKKGLKKLRELTLDSLHFQTDDDKMRLLVKAISKHECLHSCYLYTVSMTTLTSGRSGMEKLVSAMARRISKLVIIGCRLAAPASKISAGTLSATAAASTGDLNWAGSCLVKVCRSTTLQEFKLHNLDELLEEHLVLMSEALSENHSLRKLSILKSQELADAQAYNINKKQETIAKQEQQQHETLSSDAGTLALANMLRKNDALQELCLSAFDFNEYSAMFVGNALEKDNLTLHNMWLMIPAFNGGTSSFPVDDPRIGYYLRLNRAGRQIFANTSSSVISSSVQQEDQETSKASANPGRQDWVESLISSRRDIDCSYYKLRNRPCLCDTSASDDHDYRQHQDNLERSHDFGYEAERPVRMTGQATPDHVVLAC